MVLVHGLGRTPMSLLALSATARVRGYRVINWHYRSMRATIGDAAHAFAKDVAPRLAAARRVHFITHSLGGIVVRQFLADCTLPNCGRVVMLAPPNGGAVVADVLQRCGPLRVVVTPLGELGTGKRSVPRNLPRASFELGVIAGSRSHIPLFDRWMGHIPNDGVVSVASTRVDGMTDFLVLHRTHTTLPWTPDAICAAFEFLEFGRFFGSTFTTPESKSDP